MSTPKPKSSDVSIEQITSENDFPSAFKIISNCFGTQTNDGFWVAMNPGWDTPAGARSGTSRMIQRFRNVTTNDAGEGNTVYLKAVVQDPETGENVIAGVAIWNQLSMLPGKGDAPSTDLSASMDLEALYPGNEKEQRFISQVYASFVQQKVSYLQLIATSSSPATFSLDLCVVDPVFQRRGIAIKLVEWGLEEAKRRGGLESTTEGSEMGRHVYKKLGFKPVREVEYKVDEEFKGRRLPGNLFMRNGV